MRNNRWSTVLKVIISLIIPTRVLWMVYPNLLTCALFWTTMLAWRIDARESNWANPVAVAGLALNAVVTLANWGYMPVVGRGPEQSFSLWVTAAGSHHLLFLADYTAWWGFSIGDGLILGSWAALFLWWAGKKLVAWNNEQEAAGA